MSGAPPRSPEVERYLRDLGRSLPTGRRRRRILIEVEDHLAEASGQDAANPSRAVQAFGSPELVARRFAQELSWVVLRSGVALALAAVALSALLYLAAGGAPGVDAPSWVLASAAWPLSTLAIQVVALGAVATGLRAQRVRRAGATTTVAARQLARSALTAVTATAVWVVALIPSALAQSSTWATGLAGAAALTALLCLVAAAALLRAGRWRGLLGLEQTPTPSLVGDVVAGLIGVLRSLEARAPGLAQRGEAWPARVGAWLTPLGSRPGRVVVVLALIAGLAAAVGHGMTDGVGSITWGQLPRALGAGGVLLLMEGAWVTVVLATLGRPLELWPRPGADRVPAR